MYPTTTVDERRGDRDVEIPEYQRLHLYADEERNYQFFLLILRMFSEEEYLAPLMAVKKRVNS